MCVCGECAWCVCVCGVCVCVLCGVFVRLVCVVCMCVWCACCVVCVCGVGVFSDSCAPNSQFLTLNHSFHCNKISYEICVNGYKLNPVFLLSCCQ